MILYILQGIVYGILFHPIERVAALLTRCAFPKHSILFLHRRERFDMGIEQEIRAVPLLPEPWRLTHVG